MDGFTRSRAGTIRTALPLAFIAVTAAGPLHAQSGVDEGRIRSSEIAVSRQEASLKLELDDGRAVDLAIRDGEVLLDGEAVANAPSGGPLDRSWRALLNEAIESPTDRLPALLTGWDAPDMADGDRLESLLRETLAGVEVTAAAAVADADADQSTSDSVTRLLDRISELESHIEELEETRRVAPEVIVNRADDDGPSFLGVFRHIANGIAGVLSILVAYGVIFGIGFATIFFGGRRYIEGVADTARHATTRSLLVGLAASFLVVPAFILGIIALTISIVGIPALFLWIPLFPVAAAGALLLGYLAVAHAAGESLAERRFYATDWFQRGNSYYFLLTGLGLLLALFVASQVISMAGPWIGFLSGTLVALGVVITWAALSIGLGAVLISRAGTRPVHVASAEPEMFAEQTSV
jgi:hypothetical protein